MESVSPRVGGPGRRPLANSNPRGDGGVSPESAPPGVGPFDVTAAARVLAELLRAARPPGLVAPRAPLRRARAAGAGVTVGVSVGVRRMAMGLHGAWVPPGPGGPWATD